MRGSEPDIDDLKTRLWALLGAEGETLAVFDASLFARIVSTNPVVTGFPSMYCFAAT